MIKEIIKRLLLHFGYSIRKVEKLSMSFTKTTNKKIDFIKEDHYKINFKKVSTEGIHYFLPEYAPKTIKIKHNGPDKKLYGTIHEETTHKLVDELCKSFQGSVIQAGAFNGDFLPSFSKSCNGFVYAFEPVLENYIMSKLTIEKNNLENVFLYNAALGKKTETLRINTNLDKDYHIGDASKIDSEGDLCLALAIDDFSYSSLMLIQLDIEGFELNALKGAEKTIKKHHPMIAIEDNKGDCKEFLESLGYVSPVAIPGLDIYVHEQQTLHLEKLKNINSN